MPQPILVGSLLIGADERIAEYVANKIGLTPFKDFAAIGVVRRGVLLGGVVYHLFRDGGCEVSAAFESPGWALPQTLNALFSYPFHERGCIRMTAIASRKNKRSRRLIEGLGFKLEGVARRAIGGKDAILYGLLKEECRFLRNRDAAFEQGDLSLNG